ncbi:ShlB/FhaC/HecB family hemolysin secretion/activation protein [Sporomusa malonica]|uniref:Hemolysin activation/secretion protein n=2 Tax=Sporomusa malonica TaxID=112901 RepID=A0A1W2E5W2_9FIRM|nr:Hemolysin activation/secretion protein [Sporomusa malonica]
MDNRRQRKNNRPINHCLTAGLVLFMATAPLTALALEGPDAGKTLEGLKKPGLAQPQKDYKDIVIQQPPLSDKADNTTRFPIDKFRLTGEIPIPESQLQALLQDSLNQELTLADLNTLAAKISTYLHNQGYIVAAAYIPAQTIQNGIVELNIIPGKYGKIIVEDNNVLASTQAKSLIASLKPGNIIRKPDLERALLLLNDLAGVQIKAVLSPGIQSGTSDLTIEINASRETNGVIYFDNYGNKFTGTNRLGVAVNLNNPFHQGDTLAFSGITTGSGLNNYGLSYQLPLGGGWNWGVSYAHTRYALGKDFDSLDASGTADTTGIYISYPFLRSYNANISGRIGYDHKKLVDDIGASDTHTPKQTNALSIGLTGNWQEKGTAYTAYDLTYTSGQLGFDNSVDSDNDALTAQSQGSYHKTVLKLNRRQYLSNRLSLGLFFTGQYAGKNLDSSEKLSLGGANGVRAYPQGEACGDQGYQFTGEFDWQLPLKNSKDNLALALFYDQGSITTNKNLWNGVTGDNHRTLSGLGMGIILNRAEEYSLRMDYAWKLSSAAATSDTDKNGRFWLQALKYF